ncbi:hypothetical protein HanRHA438_Chr12g0574301 [Helianthus annuus]|uniref:Uncharacterized protein n=1 Tax=Helianthus annuus TaxID=4232 RepID=A0A251T593_HELAN|nr:hypothetical protein HanXRQr2_Chr12g0563021 [Helianthus annuus]KAJ0491002.1 hypothetical protein HanHA300_Chr12g0461961 [Helianthus annuus]KAJ0495353.1 hypothetical protein HanIR_Chr12g0607871 [Helianthus annuus]KAJ0506908.1 hypothetical protein HanHA89_Chr12g0487371 [Helianthus annuus]KAJ0676544.1 hypothetical protein HanLR1_Chr12g0463971 [Helianthus annuus]
MLFLPDLSSSALTICLSSHRFTAHLIHRLHRCIIFSYSLCRIGRFCLHRRFTVCLMLFC